MNKKVLDKLKELAIIEENDNLYYIVVIHEKYGSPSHITEDIVKELDLLGGQDLYIKYEYTHYNDYFLKGDIDIVRYNRKYVQAVINAKKKDLADGKGIYMIDLLGDLNIDEYDGKESLHGYYTELDEDNYDNILD
jgi:hypothetical protein